MRRSAIRNHFEESVNRKNPAIADVNVSPTFIDSGADVPPGLPRGPASAKQYVGGAYKLSPDIHLVTEDMTAEGDEAVVRNSWTGSDTACGERIGFKVTVIRRLAERRAYLDAPRKAS